MASWIDFFALVLTLSIAGGLVYGVLYISKQIKEGMNTTKERLKNKGLHISESGVSIKTSKRFDRDDYVDATQRGFIKAMSAASFGKADGPAQPVQSPGKMERNDSTSSIKTNGSGEEKKKKRKSMFGRGSKDGI